MQENPDAATAAEAEEAGAKPDFFVRVAQDRMTAWLSVRNAADVRRISYEEVAACLAENGISAGVCEPELRAFCESGSFRRVVVCAAGTPPVDGEDGVLTHMFNTAQELKPTEREDGTVDYRRLGLVQNVTKGTVLCRITPPIPGADGMDVRGGVIAHRQGRAPVLPSGVNTAPSEDGLTLLAAADGTYEFKNGQVNVQETLIIRGDVDAKTGDIDALNSVEIKGDVLEGFTVRSGGNVVVRGLAEGARIEAAGDITIIQGMNGRGQGTLKADGTIRGKFFENAALHAGGNISAQVLMNCRASAGESIVASTGWGLILGGSYRAGRTVYAKTIGNANGTATDISIQSHALDEIQTGAAADGPEELAHKQRTLEKALLSLEETENALQADSALDPALKKQRLDLIEAQKRQTQQALESVATHIQTAKEQHNKLYEYKVAASGIIYPGTKIAIGLLKTQVLQENSNTKFRAGPNEIVPVPVLPSDAPPAEML